MTITISGTSGITFPAGGTGNPAGAVVGTSDSQTLTNKTIGSGYAGSTVTSGTAVASTSGTSIDFTSIPSWVKRITVMISGMSTNGASEYVLRIGDSSGIAATGYVGCYAVNALASLSTTGFGIANGSSATATIMSGSIILTLQDAATYKWTCMGILGESDTARMTYTAGYKALAGVLDRVRVTTINGTDTFDAGSINILYE